MAHIGCNVLSHSLVSVILLLYLSMFLVVNLHNIIHAQRPKRGKLVEEVARPEGVFLTLAAFGTVAFFFEVAVFILLGFLSPGLLRMSLLQLRFPLDSSVQVLGLALMGGGFLLFIWSVLARGRHSVSWDMPEDHELVTWGPYRHVRHPSYAGYFMMFVGFCMTWLNALSLVPLVAVPGYVRLVDVEEELLVSRFGEEYRNYMSTAGRFTPRIFSRKDTRRSS